MRFVLDLGKSFLCFGDGGSGFALYLVASLLCVPVAVAVVSLLIKQQEAMAYAEDNGLLFMETSAKTAMNVNEIFLAIGKHTGALFFFLIIF